MKASRQKHKQSSRSALEADFPIIEISQVAEHESWRKEVNRPLYHIHKWWATRLGSVFRAITLAALSPEGTDIWGAFYAQHQLRDKVVLDPFMGSGTTVGEALKLGATAVGCDINPVSTFLVRQALTRVAERDLREAFKHLEGIVAPEIRRYYTTEDPHTGDPIPVMYFFWVKVVRTPAGEEIPLFDRYVFAQDAYPKKKPRAQIVCPHCWEVFQDVYDSTGLNCPQCHVHFNPQQGPVKGAIVVGKDAQYRVKELLPKDGSPPAHRLYAVMALRANGDKIYITARRRDHDLYREAAERLESEDLPLPTLAVRAGHNTNQARGYNYLHWRDFFNARQLLCHGLLLRAILQLENEEVREQMLCLFSSNLEFNNLFCSFKGEGTGAVRHMFSNHILKPERTPLENSIWGTEKSSGTFKTLFESRLLRAKRYLDNPFEIALNEVGDIARSRKVCASEPISASRLEAWSERKAGKQGVLILNGDSATLPLPAASVDAIITDPPYFDFVHYSELSDFFFAWLSPVLRKRYAWFDRVDSSDDGEVQHKDPRTFAKHLSHVFAEGKRVLKDDGVLAFSFHHSRPEGWAAIYEAITLAGFEVVEAHPMHGEIRGSSPKNAAKEPISLDAILVCKKPGASSSKRLSVTGAIEKALEQASQLVQAGMTLSLGDRFVIAASQILVALSTESMTFEAIQSIIDQMQKDLRTVSIEIEHIVVAPVREANQFKLFA